MIETPNPETTAPSTSEHFKADAGWVWCPAPFEIEGVTANWYWNGFERCYGISAHTIRSFPRMGQVGIHIDRLDPSTLDPEMVTRKLGELVHEFVALEAMG